MNVWDNRFSASWPAFSFKSFSRRTDNIPEFQSSR
jgi:hypothetical protein